MNNRIKEHLDGLIRRTPELSESRENVLEVYTTLKNLFFKSGTLFLCGNGGSASDGEHIVGELMKGFLKKRPMPQEMAEKFCDVPGGDELTEKLQMGLRAISLNNHYGISSAFTNDVDPLLSYAQQLFVLGRSGDAVLGLSTSGNARNICHAFRTARAMGITTILFTGRKRGICTEFSDVILSVPSEETFRIQEFHLPIYHTLCMMLEETFYEK